MRRAVSLPVLGFALVKSRWARYADSALVYRAVCPGNLLASTAGRLIDAFGQPVLVRWLVRVGGARSTGSTFCPQIVVVFADGLASPACRLDVALGVGVVRPWLEGVDRAPFAIRVCDGTAFDVVGGFAAA